MKLKLFLERTNKQGKINNEDFSKALEKLPEDLELPDVWVNLFDENFLTRERATADFEITKKIKAETLNGVDEKLKSIFPLLDPTDRETLEKEPNTYKKVEAIGAAIPKLLEKVKGDNPTNDEVVKQLKKDVKEFSDKVIQANQDREQKIKELQEKYEQEKSNLKLDWTLDKKLSEFVLAEEFSTIRPAIIKNIVDTVKASNSLQLDEKGQIVVVDIDHTTKVTKPKFNGNDPVTIDSLLVEPLKPFLKKNNGDGGKDQQQQQQNNGKLNTRVVAKTDNSPITTNLDRRRSARQNTPV